MCMYHIFIHSYVNEHICYFHVLAIINRAAMSIEVHISFWTMFFFRYMHVLCLVAQLCPTVCDSMDCSPPGSSVHGDSPGKNSGVGSHALLQGIFPTQGLNPGSPTLEVDSLPSESPGKPRNTGVGSLSLLQGSFPTQELNPGLLHGRWILYQLGYQGSLEEH